MRRCGDGATVVTRSEGSTNAGKGCMRPEGASFSFLIGYRNSHEPSARRPNAHPRHARWRLFDRSVSGEYRETRRRFRAEVRTVASPPMHACCCSVFPRTSDGFTIMKHDCPDFMILMATATENYRYPNYR